MGYIVKSTERLKGSSSEHETKALLYLMSFRIDSNEIEYFVIDFFNDLSGVDKFPSQVWDLQSKGAKSLSAKEIGKSLVTLFKNFNQKSLIPFSSYILFLNGIPKFFRIDNNENEFGISNINSKVIAKIKLGLIEEASKKTYINTMWINDTNINDFLNKVTFHISSGTKIEYIKKLINSTTIKLPSDLILESVFDEIKNTQSSKKDILVENEVLNRLDEFIQYNKHLKRSEILLLILNRIINNNVLSSSVPTFFIPIYNNLADNCKKDKLEDCQNAMALMLYDKNNKDNIWLLYENIYKIIKSNNDIDVNEVYDLVDKGIAGKIIPLDALSLKYLISLIKGGFNEN